MRTRRKIARVFNRHLTSHQSVVLLPLHHRKSILSIIAPCSCHHEFSYNKEVQALLKLLGAHSDSSYGQVLLDPLDYL